MKKLLTYLLYLYEYVKYGDFISVMAAVRYVLSRKSHRHDRVIRTGLGRVFCRKGTNDFQFANYRYEWGVKRFVLAHAEAFDILIDGGACIGTYSLLMAGKGLRCIAFEPMQSSYDVLCRNVAMNGFTDRIKCMPVALGDTDTRAFFECNPVNTGASHLATINNGSNCREVEIKTLDSIRAEMGIAPGDRILFKLDVEGMEAEAIAGAANLIREARDITLVVEVKHSGENRIIPLLHSLGTFEIGQADPYNIYARKIPG